MPRRWRTHSGAAGSRTDTGFYVADGILCVDATRAGVPAFTFETGEGGRLEEAIIDDGAVYVRNAMKWLKMIDGDPVPPEKTWVMKEFLGLRAQRGGAAAHPGAAGGHRGRGRAPVLHRQHLRRRGGDHHRAGARGVRALDHALDRIARRAGRDARTALSAGVEKARLAARIDSQNPPGDTTAIVEAIEAVLDTAAGIEHRRVVGREPAVNLVARVRGAGPGRRLVLNGHLDTFPIGEARWSHPPLGAVLEDGRIYGRGACDMKAGVAALVLAFVTLAEFRDAWDGELVLTLVGDEETGGRWGTQYLLANVEEAVGDAMLNADTGSPRVVRIGVNTIPDRARALCDIRIPPGVTVDRVRAELASAIDPLPDVSWRIIECTEPSWTDPEEAIVRAVRENAAAVTGRDVVVNLRAGFSDARFYRHAGVPSVVYGVGAHHMGGVDEQATVEDLKTVFAVHAFAAFDHLRGR